MSTDDRPRFDAAKADDVVDRAMSVAECLNAAGHRSFVVGGLVRDLHLGGTSSHDVDITTDATPDVMKSLFAPIADALWSQGERFGTIGLRIDDTDFEVTTHRSEQYDPTSRKPIVEFSTAIEADLSRRDFTVNAMAMELPGGVIIDPFGGASDLAAGVLRTPGSPDASFTDDPLRMLRAARFHAGYGLEPVAELEAAMVSYGERIEIVSQERIRDEMAKLLALDEPGPGISLLGRTGVLGLIVPDYDRATADVVAGFIGAVPNEPLARRAAFYLPLAERGSASRLTGHLAMRRFSAKEQRQTRRVLDATLWAAERSDFASTDAGVREFLAIAGPAAETATMLIGLDHLVGPVAVAVFETRRDELELRESMVDFGPALSGAEVMAALEISPGPDVGAALEFLAAVRIADGVISRAEAVERLTVWRSEQSLASG